MFGTLGGQEIILILVIALIVFGPRKLPEIGKSVGRMMAEFRKASNDFRRTLEEEVEAEKARPPEPAAPLRAEPPVDSPESTAPTQAEAPQVSAPSEGDTPQVSAPAEGDTPAAPAEPTVAREEPVTVGRPDGRPVEPR